MEAYVKVARVNVNFDWAVRDCWWGIADALDSTTLVKDCGAGNVATGAINVPFW